MDVYTTSSIAKLFGVTDQTVKNWAKEFAEHLSPTAQPPEGQKRMFTLDDIRVFALVADFSKRGFSYEDAHTSLRSGQRGDIPETAKELSPTVSPQIVAALREENSALQTLLTDRTRERDEAVGQVKLLERQLGQKDKRIEELYRENAELRVKSEGKQV